MTLIIDSITGKPHLHKMNCREETIAVISAAGRYCCNQTSTV